MNDMGVDLREGQMYPSPHVGRLSVCPESGNPWKKKVQSYTDGEWRLHNFHLELAYVTNEKTS